jgi:hypothetical protein
MENTSTIKLVFSALSRWCVARCFSRRSVIRLFSAGVTAKAAKHYILIFRMTG